MCAFCGCSCGLECARAADALAAGAGNAVAGAAVGYLDEAARRDARRGGGCGEKSRILAVQREKVGETGQGWTRKPKLTVMILGGGSSGICFGGRSESKQRLGRIGRCGGSLLVRFDQWKRSNRAGSDAGSAHASRCRYLQVPACARRCSAVPRQARR